MHCSRWSSKKPFPNDHTHNTFMSTRRFNRQWRLLSIILRPWKNQSLTSCLHSRKPTPWIKLDNTAIWLIKSSKRENWWANSTISQSRNLIRLRDISRMRSKTNPLKMRPMKPLWQFIKRSIILSGRSESKHTKISANSSISSTLRIAKIKILRRIHSMVAKRRNKNRIPLINMLLYSRRL